MQSRYLIHVFALALSTLLGCAASDDTLDPVDVRVGEIWGPCPISDVGTIDLCNSEALACVPADDGAANACLPVGGCPDNLSFGDHGDVGWGDVCYARCESASDCLDGQVCGSAVSDGSSMCAWPISSPSSP